MRTLLVTAIVASLAGCQEYDVRAGADPGAAAPDIEVDPPSLSFGPASASDQIQKTFTIRNVGSLALDVSALVLDAGAPAFRIVTAAPLEILAGEEATVEVAFTPVGELSYGQILVQSDDPDEPSVPVALEGLGQVPALAITPEWYVFPSACEDAVELRLENVGLEDLVIDAMRYDGPSDLTWVDENVLPLTLAPGAWTTTRVAYLPSGSSAALGELAVDSNDPRGTRTAEQSAEGASGTITELFEVVEDPPIDILFALDKSGSMTDDARNLGDAFEDFISEVDLATSDWQIGVVTKDTGCFNNGILTSSTPTYEEVFIDAVSGLGLFAGDLTEALLELTDVSLQETAPGGCNQGFVRADSLLHIVAISDEPEQSGQPWDHWVGRYQANMTDPNLVVVSVVVDLTGCESGAAGYVEAATATGGLQLDICNSNWGAFAAQLGTASAASLQTYLLSSVPDPSTIEVSVDGVDYTTGWHYDALRNAVVIDVDLPTGSEVAVTYVSVGC